jgi:hypothetical protein
MGGNSLVLGSFWSRYAQDCMSTRKLILLSLACGLAILAAAAAQLFLATR